MEDTFRRWVSVPALFLLLYSSFLALLSHDACAGRTGVAVFRRSEAVAGGAGEEKRYAVIFDAGSSGSRVHVFSFGESLELLPINGDELELFLKVKPGLSAYASNPDEAANSLLPLLEKAEAVIPESSRAKTPVRVGATAGLRLLGTETSERILKAVRDLLQKESSLSYEAEYVSILDGTQEGSYMWVAINYLLGRTGEPYPRTVGVVDLGGGSVQMAYAVPRSTAANAPKIENGTYVKELSLMGAKYYLYVHSYLNYGLLAARVQILKDAHGLGRFCVLRGFNGTYKYGGETYDASSPPSGASYSKCRRAVLKALDLDAPCEHDQCTFGGVWNGGGGDGQKNLYVSSFFYDKAAQSGFINGSAPTAVVKPYYFEKEARRACRVSLEDAKSTVYPNVYADDLPYICMDLVYQYALLVDGFGLKPWQKVTLVTKLQYGEFLVESAWPLGSAIEALSSSTTAAVSAAAAHRDA